MFSCVLGNTLRKINNLLFLTAMVVNNKHVDKVLLLRSGSTLQAVAAGCTHRLGNLAESSKAEELQKPDGTVSSFQQTDQQPMIACDQQGMDVRNLNESLG